MRHENNGKNGESFASRSRIGCRFPSSFASATSLPHIHGLRREYPGPRKMRSMNQEGKGNSIVARLSCKKEMRGCICREIRFQGKEKESSHRLLPLSLTALMIDCSTTTDTRDTMHAKQEVTRVLGAENMTSRRENEWHDEDIQTHPDDDTERKKRR